MVMCFKCFTVLNCSQQTMGRWYQNLTPPLTQAQCYRTSDKFSIDENLSQPLRTSLSISTCSSQPGLASCCVWSLLASVRTSCSPELPFFSFVPKGCGMPNGGFLTCGCFLISGLQGSSFLIDKFSLKIVHSLCPPSNVAVQMGFSSVSVERSLSHKNPQSCVSKAVFVLLPRIFLSVHF